MSRLRVFPPGLRDLLCFRPSLTHHPHEMVAPHHHRQNSPTHHHHHHHKNHRPQPMPPPKVFPNLPHPIQDGVCCVYVLFRRPMTIFCPIASTFCQTNKCAPTVTGWGVFSHVGREVRGLRARHPGRKIEFWIGPGLRQFSGHMTMGPRAFQLTPLIVFFSER